MNLEQERQRVLEIIKMHNDKPSSLIQVLNAIQEAHGYLPKDVQQLVAEEMKIPFSKVYEVVSFYTRFTMEKSGKYEISVCMGTACYVRGAQDTLDELKAQLNVSENQTTADGLYTLISCRCLGCCALAPVVRVNEDIHGHVTAERVSEMLAAYK